MYDSQAHQRIDEIEKLIAEKHEDAKAFVNSLKLKYGTDEERAAQAAQAEADAKAPKHADPTVGLSLQDALKRLAELEERERKRNLAAEVGLSGKAAIPVPSGT